MVPVNMRPAEWRQEVVGNLLLPVRVATRRGDRSSPLATLEAVARQSRRIKGGGTGGALIEVLGRSPSFPVGFKEATSPMLRILGSRLADSALLSNLATLDDPPSFTDGAAGGDAGARGGPGETIELWFSAPARMPLGVSVGIVTAMGHLHAVFRYRHPQFDADAARRFAERWVATVEQFPAL